MTNSIENIKNAYGQVDCRQGIPSGFVHLTSPASAQRCRKLGVSFARALVAVREGGRRYPASPQFCGVVVSADDAALLGAGAKVKGTITDRQLQAIEAMDLNTLVTLSIECMHALNRRAKAQPQKARKIYELKNRWIKAMVTAGRHTSVGRFETTKVIGMEYMCCGRTWHGPLVAYYEEEDEYDEHPTSICHRCSEDVDGHESFVTKVWYLVKIGDRSFHQPGPASATLDQVSSPIESHDPTNPNTEIPKIGQVIPAQFRAVERVIELLTQQIN